jgi:glycosyltransferase involved in cell wall biosynthesis
MTVDQPLVTILTPVYNGAKYLSECIESVLSQDYNNWEYIIVNNCSSDLTLEIATRYALSDSRIRVVSNPHFVDVIENHNIAFTYISWNSKYCKVVSADDWIYPECIKRMVQLAEANPSVAIVGCYTISSEGVKYVGLPPERSVFSGEEVCRLHLLGGPQVMGDPTSVLYRSEIVKSSERFFPGHTRNADIAACYRSLQQHDFGFIHQILAFMRIHDAALSAEQGRLRGFTLDKVAFVADYGRIFLSPEEFYKRFDEVLDEYYYDVLAPMFIKGCRKEEPWGYHRSRLKELGIELDRIELLRALIARIIDLVFNPKRTIEKLIKHQRAAGSL